MAQKLPAPGSMVHMSSVKIHTRRSGHLIIAEGLHLIFGWPSVLPLAAQADDLEPNIGLHWYLAAQLHGALAPGLQGLRGPTRALLHALAGAYLGCACSALGCP